MNRNIALLILRLASGGLMLTHAYPKFSKLIAGDFTFADPIGLGEELSLVLTVFSEGICSIFIILGYYTKLASLPLLFTMIVAVFVVHLGDPLAKQEMGILYGSMYAALALAGPGQYSLDYKVRKK